MDCCACHRRVCAREQIENRVTLDVLYVGIDEGELAVGPELMCRS